MLFTKDFLYLDDQTVIAMQFIESMRFTEGEDLTADKLKDDLHLDVVMASSKEYSISVRRQYMNDVRAKPPTSIEEMREAIYKKWIFILTGKS